MKYQWLKGTSYSKEINNTLDKGAHYDYRESNW